MSEEYKLTETTMPLNFNDGASVLNLASGTYNIDGKYIVTIPEGSVIRFEKVGSPSRLCEGTWMIDGIEYVVPKGTEAYVTLPSIVKNISHTPHEK